jgi:hypothetical protein
MRAVILSVTLLFFAGVAPAAPVAISVVKPVDAAPASGATVYCEAGAVKVSEALQEAGQGLLTANLELEAGLVWTVQVEAPGYWSAPQTLFVEATGGSIHLKLIPTADVTGTVKTDQDRALEDQLTLRFRSLPGQDDPAIDEEVDCELTDQSFRCEIPQGTWDLQLQVPEMISHFFWGVELMPVQTVELGELELRRGISVAGWVETEEGPAAGKGCKVSLETNPGGLMPEEQKQRNRARAISGSTNERGFFQLTGVKPGQYILTVEKDGYVPGTVYPVDLKESEEVTLQEPVVLYRPLVLEVHLDPPFDPSEEDWRVSLVEVLPFKYRQIASDAATRGLWRQEMLAPGSYLFMITDGSGSTWHSSKIELQPDQQRLDISIELIPVEGTVHFGEQPVAAALLFKGESSEDGSSFAVTLHSDEEGAVEGFLPREGSWDVVISADSPSLHRVAKDVEVRVPDGGRVARIEIIVPDHVLAGTVVNEDEIPVADARVRCVGLELGARGVIQTTRSDDDGRFELRGLSQGNYLISAETRGARSEEHTLELDPDDPPDELKLVLIDDGMIEGQVVDGSGAGVAGATLFRFAPGAGSQTPVATDVDGWFKLEVPRSVDEMVVNVLAPGHCLLMRRISTEDTSRHVTLVLGSQSGTLLIQPAQQELAVRGLIVTLIGSDGLTFEFILGQWSWQNGSISSASAEGKLTVPMMEPGSYELCALTMPELNMVLGTSMIADSKACAAGFLEPGGLLELAIPDIE